MEPDTVSHHFWPFDDEASPRHREGPRGAIADVYEALDRSLGELLHAAGEGADVLLLSDHGSAGASDRIVFWNRWLADHGHLAFAAGGGASLAGALKRGAMALLPPAWQARAFAAAGPLADRLESGARFAGIDWDHTALYSDEVPYFPSLRVNLAGREPRGTVRASDLDRLLGDVTAELLAERDPFDGGPVVERVQRREELFDGPFADRYPDLILTLRRPDGYAYAAASSRGGAEPEWMRRLRDEETSGAKGSAMGGVHSDFGMALLARDGLEPSPADGECSLADLGATVLAMAGVVTADGVQGRSVLAGVADVSATASSIEVAAVQVRRRDTNATSSSSDVTAQASPSHEVDYDADAEREVEERLRALGYLP